MASTIFRRIVMAAALGMIALNTIGDASADQVKIALPDAKEFREGDSWSAHVPGTKVYVGVKKINGHFVQANYSIDDYLNDQKPGARKFTDLDGAAPNFPADHERLFAAPDGTLYGFFNGQWHHIQIGHRFPTVLGAIDVTERMTQIQADVMSQELVRRAKMAKTLPSFNKTVLRPMIKMDGNILRINTASELSAKKSELDCNLQENLQLGKTGEGLQQIPAAVRRMSKIDNQQAPTDHKFTTIAARAAARAVIANALRYVVVR